MPIPPRLTELRARDPDAYVAGMYYWNARCQGPRRNNPGYKSRAMLAEECGLALRTFNRALARAKVAVPELRRWDRERRK